MIGASLSRWTMSYFAAALLALMAAELLMAAGFGFPSYPIEAPETLILVHVVAIGWLSLLVSGALIQFVPVLVARPLVHPELPVVALTLLVLGLASLVLGFLGMAGYSVGSLPWLPLGAIGLTSGFVLNLWNLGRTIWAARPIGLPARFVVAGLLSLAGVTTFGTIFAFTLGGWTANPMLVRLTAQGISLHAALGLGGWLTFTAMGVSYRLLAMFMLAPEAEHRTSRLALLTGSASILVLLVGGPLCLLAVRTKCDASAPCRARSRDRQSRPLRLRHRPALSHAQAAEARTQRANRGMGARRSRLIRPADAGSDDARRDQSRHRRDHVSVCLWLAHRTRPCQALQDRRLPYLARMLRSAAR